MSTIINRIFENLATRLMFIIYILFIVVTAFFIGIGYYQELGLQEDRQYDRLQGVVSALASSIDGDSHEFMMANIQSESSQNKKIASSIYSKLNQKLSLAESATKLESVIYTLSKRKSDGKFYYGVRSDNYVDINNRYLKVPKQLTENYEIGGVIPAYETENGSWISAFHPIKNNKGEVVALLEADIEFSKFKAIVNDHFFKRLLISLIVILVIFFVFAKYTKKVLKEEVEKKKLLSDQKRIIERKNKDITDSMHYALRIQNTILPAPCKFKESFSDCFTYYKSKDIVAGDFYWLEKIDNEVFIAVADCTGHGVPGAILSIICANILDNVIVDSKVKDTGLILDKVREKVIEYLTSGEFAMNDGMDISLCRINMDTKELQYSGANNPIYVLKDGVLDVIKACKQPIGKYDFAKEFETATCQLKRNDQIYMFTDGFADQFGGPNNKKFKYKSFKELLVETGNAEEMNRQKNDIEKVFVKWKGDQDQIDDVCVIGIRI